MAVIFDAFLNKGKLYDEIQTSPNKFCPLRDYSSHSWGNFEPIIFFKQNLQDIIQMGLVY